MLRLNKVFVAIVYSKYDFVLIGRKDKVIWNFTKKHEVIELFVF